MATKPTKPTTKADDAFEVVDPSEDTGSAPVKEQSFTPAVYSDDFDDGLDPARLKVPSMNLVHGVGEYKTHYTVGTFVIGNLDRAVEILKGNLEKFKDPARAKTEGRFTCAVVAVSRPVFQPDVKQEDPNFKVELADKAAVAEAGGTTDRKVSYATGQQFYVPKSECLLLIRKPEWVDADNDDFFPHELDGVLELRGTAALPAPRPPEAQGHQRPDDRRRHSRPSLRRLDAHGRQDHPDPQGFVLRSRCDSVPGTHRSGSL
jgi:hypothetical protein